jgi:hypothetical protein
MLSLAPLLVLFVLGLLVGGALLVAARLERRRARVIARQVRLTDAIHREFGAVVSPVVEKSVFGPWQARFAVPLQEPAVVGRLVAIAEDVLADERTAGGAPRVVLTSRAETERTRVVARRV